METTQRGMANTVFTVKYRNIPKKNTKKDSEKISRVKTDKDQKCNGNSDQQDRDQQGQQLVFP
jgi:hypothetical protein